MSSVVFLANISRIDEMFLFFASRYIQPKVSSNLDTRAQRNTLNLERPYRHIYRQAMMQRRENNTHTQLNLRAMIPDPAEKILAGVGTRRERVMMGSGEARFGGAIGD